MKTRNAKLLRQKKDKLKELKEKHSHLLETQRSDDMQHFMVANKIAKLEAEINGLSA